jgi:uncharacterized protein YndB with AHSA1/START domain
VSAPPERVFEFLADLRNHWRLEQSFVDLDEMGPEGGRVRVRGPLGLSRSARTQVLEAVPHERLRGRADIGRRTVGLVAWDLVPADGGGTHVRLAASVPHAAPLDRVLLVLGGRAWLALLFRRALRRLAEVVS